MMAYQFTPAPMLQEGALFLGLRDGVQKAGIVTPRHLITIAGARSGKGAALIIPNLRSWSAGSVLVVDPKGENAEHSWEQREAMGHKVYVVDPFKVANVPDRLRASLNPLDDILKAKRERQGQGRPSTAREDIRVLADGLVMRYNADDATWDNGAVTVIAGMIAHNLTTAPEGHRTLAAVRAVLRMPEDQLTPIFEDMAANPDFGSLAQAAATIALSSAKSAREFVKGAQDQTEWLDAEPMQDVLSQSDFSLSELKNGKTAIFLVLPPQYLDEHGRFLRLFVRCAINAMAQGGQGGGKCLFVLDEFFSLGHIDQIVKAAGLLPSYGVHLWPFLQDLGQLVKLYGPEGAGTFFGNADAHIFFGNTDPFTLDHISQRLGTVTPKEIGPAPVHVPSRPSSPNSYTWMTGGRQSSGGQIMSSMLAGADNIAGGISDHFAAQAAANYQMKAASIGQPRLAPDEVRELVARHHTDTVARSMIAFATGGAVYNLRLHPYFQPDPVPPPPPKSLFDEIDSLLSSVSSQVYFGAAFLVFMLAGKVAGSSISAKAFGVLIVAGSLAFIGFIRRGEERREAVAQIARDKAAGEASPPPP
jgi:hypothetical protein